MSDPSNPVHRGELDDGTASDVVVLGSVAYLASSDGIRVMDRTDPSIPRVLTNATPGAGSVGTLSLQGTWLYGSSSGQGLLALDVSDSRAPRSVSTGLRAGFSTGVAALGNRVLLAGSSPELTVVNVSRPDTFPIVGRSRRDVLSLLVPILHRFAIRSGLSNAEAQDAVQETMLVVAKQMPEFRYDPAKGSFWAWLYTQARWRIADAFRRRQKAGHAGPPSDATVRRHRPTPPSDATSTGTAEAERLADPASEQLEAAWDTEWREHQLARPLVRMKPQVSARQFQRFHLAAVKGWAMADITRTLKVNRAQVYMAKMRLSRLVKGELARLEG